MTAGFEKVRIMGGWQAVVTIAKAPLRALCILSVLSTMLVWSETDAQETQSPMRFNTEPVPYSADPACRPARVVIQSEPGEEEANFVSAVNAGPARDYISIDTVRDGEWVSLCQFRPDESDLSLVWAGIVYGGTPEHCGILDAPEISRAYAGRCRWGWVDSADIETTNEGQIARR